MAYPDPCVGDQCRYAESHGHAETQPTALRKPGEYPPPLFVLWPDGAVTERQASEEAYCRCEVCGLAFMSSDALSLQCGSCQGTIPAEEERP
jgi:hypothetical protein